jgi:hypothetical protein
MSKKSRIIWFSVAFIAVTLFLTYWLLKWIGVGRVGMFEITRADFILLFIITICIFVCIVIPMLIGMGLRYILPSVNVGLVSMFGATLVFSFQHIWENTLVKDYEVLALPFVGTELIIIQLTLGIIFGLLFPFVFASWGVRIMDKIRARSKKIPAQSSETILKAEPEKL